MARKMNRLSARYVTSAGEGVHADGGGLLLQVKNGGRSWVFRYSRGGKETWLGLGPVHTVSLAEARQRAQACRLALLDGKDPLALKRDAEVPAKAVPSFADVCGTVHAMKLHEWRSAKHGEQWFSTLKTYAFPVLDGGKRPIDRVGKDDVLAILRPIWTRKVETASRVRQRLEEVLAYATAAGHRSGLNPATRDALRGLLAKTAKIKTVRHHPAVPVPMAAKFYKRASEMPGVGALALRYIMLTACRSGEARNAVWSEVDLEGKVWSIPGSRTKTGKALRVPLSDEALKVLEAAKQVQHSGVDLIFPSPSGKALSDMAVAAVVKRMNEQDGGKWVDKAGDAVVPHGLRSTFRDWCGEATSFPRELIELCLGHAVASATEGAYWRGDALDRRRPIMDGWADHCTRAETPTVVPLRRRARKAA